MNQQSAGYRRTLYAVEAQTYAMAVDIYDIGLWEPVDKRMMRREWSRDKLLDHVGFLRHMNASGRDIYIRPLHPSPIVLLDDLSRASVVRLLTDDPTVACIVETSPSNYQAWVHTFEQHPTYIQLNRIATELAERYGGDLKSANYRQYGRLAGFTNRKTKHRLPNGKQPFVLLHSTDTILRRQGDASPFIPPLT